MATLSELRDRVEQVLADTSNTIWDSGWIDEGLHQALEEYSLVNPQYLVTTATFAAAGRELDVSDLTPVYGISEVWCPYTAADPEHPPNRRNFEFWRDLDLLYFPDGDEPDATDVARIFYLEAQTIEDLESATSTTLPAEDERLLITGAAGHVAASRGLDLTENVTMDKITAQQVRAWGLAKLQEFRSGLRDVTTRLAGRRSSVIKIGKLDRYDGEWT